MLADLHNLIFLVLGETRKCPGLVHWFSELPSVRVSLPFDWQEGLCGWYALDE